MLLTLKILFEGPMEKCPEIKDISEKKAGKHTDTRKKGKHLVYWRNCLEVRNYFPRDNLDLGVKLSLNKKANQEQQIDFASSVFPLIFT